MSDIEEKYYEKNLSFSVKNLRDCLRKEKYKKDRMAKFTALKLTLYIILLLITYLLTNKHFDDTLYVLEVILYALLAGVCINFIFSYKGKDKYENYRLQLMEFLSKDSSSGMCNCNSHCSCKEDFLKDMFDEGIDLIKK